MKWSKKALLEKMEGTYGVDPVPTDAANAQLFIAENVTLTPIAAEKVKREIIRAGGEFGTHPSYLAGKYVMLEFSQELAGAGAAGTAPKYGPGLRGAGLAETINAGVSVEYDPVSESQESTAIYMHIDGHLHKLLGVRGDVTLELTINQRPMIRRRVMGMFVAVADAAFPSPDYTGFQKPLLVSDVNTPTLTLHGVAVKVSALNLDLGNAVEYRELVNSTTIEITDRQSTGQITIENVAVATKDWYGAVTGETLGALQIIHGTVAGNIVQIDAPKVQLSNPRPAGSQDKAMLTLDLDITPDTGDDEIKITVK